MVSPGDTERSPRSSIPGKAQHHSTCLMPRSCISSQLGLSWAGLLRARRCQEPLKHDSWCQLLGNKFQGQGCTCSVEQRLHLTGSAALHSVFSSQLKLGRTEMQLLPPTSLHREGTGLMLLSPLTTIWAAWDVFWVGFSHCHLWTFGHSPARTCLWICKTKSLHCT